MKNSHKITLICYFLAHAVAAAQVPALSPKDRKELAYLSRRLVGETLKDFLNAFTFDGLSQSERKEMGLNSYLPNSNQLFMNEDIVIEDDSDPKQFDYQNTRDVSVSRYLSNMDLFYHKSDTNSIEFKRVVILKTELKEQPFTIVGFQSVFKNLHKPTQKPYQPTERLVEIRFDKIDKQWVGYIVGIRFARPTAPTENQPATGIVARPSKIELKNAKKKIDELLKLGQQAIKEGNYKVKAMAYFEQARQLNTQMGLQNEAMLRFAELYERKGDAIFEAEIYENALQWYQIAKSLNDSEAIQAKVKLCMQQYLK